MAPEGYVLAVDHGTSGVKTSLVSLAGRVLATETRATPMTFLEGGGAEQDPDGWWAALVETARAVVAKGLVPRDAIRAACVSSTFSSTVAVDASGRALMNALTWMDSRGAKYVRRLMRGFPSVEGYGLANLLRWIPKTAGGPTLSGKDDIAHVLLVKEEFPDVYRRTSVFLPSKDYLNLRLTGRVAASVDSMTLFWVTDTRDLARVRYDAKLIARLGIDGGKLPPLVPSTEVLGTLAPDVAAAIGLPEAVKVVAGSPDHQSAGIGSGAVRDFEGHVYVGTSSWVQCVVPFKKTDVFHSIASLPTAIPGRYYAANEQDLAGGCLTFFVDAVLYPPGTPRPENPYARVDELAAASPPGAGKVLFTPWLNGERSPVDDNALRGGFHNLAKTTTAADLARAVLEGVALNARWNLGYVEKFIGRRMDPLAIVGGGAQSDLWCQIFADVTDRTIRKVRGPREANARGAAFIAGVGLGAIRFADVPGLVEIEKTFAPDPANRKVYDEAFRAFLAVYKANRGLYRRLNG